MSNVSKAQSERIEGIDYLKGILIVLMVLGHSGCPNWLHDAIYLFHMPCFFVISGFLFSEKSLENEKKYIKRKFSSLWWPYVLWTCVYVLLHNVFTSLHFYETSYSVREIIIYLTRSCCLMWQEQMGGAFWFLKALLFASLASFLWYKIWGCTIRSKLLGVVSTLIILLIFIFICRERLLTIKLCIFATAFFMLGVYCKDICHRYRTLKSNYILIVLVLSVLCILAGRISPTGMGDVSIMAAIPYFVVSSIVSISLIIICSSIDKLLFSHLFGFLGRRSLEIMVFHFVAFKPVSWLIIICCGYDIERMSDFGVIQQDNSLWWIMYTLIGVIGSILIASAISKGTQYGVILYSHRFKLSRHILKSIKI